MSSPAVAVPDVPMVVRIEGSVPVIELPDALAFEALRAWIREQLPLQTDIIGGRSSRLDLGDRAIKLFDLRRVLHLLQHEFQIDVTGIYVDGERLHRFAEQELKLKVFLHDESADAQDDEPPTELMDVAEPEEATAEADLVDDAEESDEPAEEAEEADEDGLPSAEKLADTTLPHDLAFGDLDGSPAATPRPVMRVVREEPAEPRVRTIEGTLRSGFQQQFEGDIIVYGDVNPGAQLVATGNIVVLGTLKGMAHAGAGGNEDAFIMALQLRPTQLRIGRKIAVPPTRDRDFVPERARVEDGQIVIEPFSTGRR